MMLPLPLAQIGISASLRNALQSCASTPPLMMLGSPGRATWCPMAGVLSIGGRVLPTGAVWAKGCRMERLHRTYPWQVVPFHH